jgi:hypothetical protein
VLATLQVALDFAYSRVLALLFLQLVMLAMILVPFGLLISAAAPLHHVVSVIAGVTTGLWLFYRFRTAVIAAAIAALLGVGLWLAPAVWVDGLAWIAVLSLLYDWWMRVCEERFRLVRPVGWVLWTISVVTVIEFATHAASNDLAMWVWGALSAIEVILLLVVLWWLIAAPVMLAWLCTSAWASHRRGAGAAAGAPIDVRAKSSVGTGRFGLFPRWGFHHHHGGAGYHRSRARRRARSVCRTISSTRRRRRCRETRPRPTVHGGAFFRGLRPQHNRFPVIAFLLFPLIVYLVVMLMPACRK